MEQFLAKIIPVVFIFFLGFFLKKVNALKAEHGDVFLKLVFYVCFPALSFLAVMDLRLTTGLIFIPIIPGLVIGITWVLAKLASKPFHMPKATLGTFLVGSMIMNTGFTLPFFLAGYGYEGFARAALFDVGNSFFIFTFIYFIAVKHSDQVNTHAKMFKKFLFLPQLWAFIIGLLLRGLGITLIEPVRNAFTLIGNPTIPLIMLALGLYFTPRILHIRKVITVISLRMFIGLGLGLFFAWLFHLETISRIIVIASCAAPVGYNTLVFSSLENLDKEFASTVVSFSILFGIVFIPLLFFILGIS